MVSIHFLINRRLLSLALLGHRLRYIYLQSISSHRLTLASARTGLQARRAARRGGVLEREAFPGEGGCALGMVVKRLVFSSERGCWARQVLECGGLPGEGSRAS